MEFNGKCTKCGNDKVFIVRTMDNTFTPHFQAVCCKCKQRGPICNTEREAVMRFNHML